MNASDIKKTEDVVKPKEEVIITNNRYGRYNVLTKQVPYQENLLYEVTIKNGFSLIIEYKPLHGYNVKLSKGFAKVEFFLQRNYNCGLAELFGYKFPYDLSAEKHKPLIKTLNDILNSVQNCRCAYSSLFSDILFSGNYQLYSFCKRNEHYNAFFKYLKFKSMFEYRNPNYMHQDKRHLYMRYTNNTKT